MKYQFCIRFEKMTENTAATKAVLDCNAIFLEQGYKDYTLTVWDNSKKLRYYILLIKELFRFFKAIDKGAIVGIQYPLLSINNVFYYFVKLAKLKGVKFFCIIHDLESLRTGGTDKQAIKKEVANLNAYDHVIAHNELMVAWLQENGLTTQTSVIGMFDYLTQQLTANKVPVTLSHAIAFAGNLSKSTFIYQLDNIALYNFNLYGPNFNQSDAYKRLHWHGSISSERIAEELSGDFGLIWDGDDIEKCTGVMGEYLKFNNPHKFSLYMAAGLPVIAPASSAISSLIKVHNLGFVVDSLYELKNVQPTLEEYLVIKKNVNAFQDKVSRGYFFNNAINNAEKILTVK